MDDEIDSQIPNTSSAWQLWHHDMFDRDSSPFLQASGTNIVQGLYELWLCTLKEGILENGSASFSRFHLTWGKTATARVDVFVKPFNNLSLIKITAVGSPGASRPKQGRRTTNSGITETGTIAL